MIKKLIRGGVILGAALAAVAGMSAYEAHVINVTAHIENALGVSAYGIDYGTVFPQENHEEDFTVSLSQSFIDEGRVDDVEYVIKQKPKQWRDEFDGTHPEHRELAWVDPDNNGSYTEDGQLHITTGTDIEDLFGPSETAGDWTAPRKVMLSGGNFEAETHVVNTTPGTFYESAGLLAYGQDGDLVRLEVTNWSSFGMGYVVYMESQEAKVKTGKKYASLPGYAGSVYLKMSREGDIFKGYMSNDGSSWTEVSTVLEGKNDFENNLASLPAMVGVSVVRSNPTSGGTFTGNFDYLAMNGKYQDFCRFLSKVKAEDETGEHGDVDHPSYYTRSGCIGVGETRPEASGVLSKPGDSEDTWVVDLKVPPIAGYVSQDWPESCRQDWVVPQEDDYGCDLWVEVTGISEDRD